MNKIIQDCVVACWDCRHECQKVFFTHCLDMGGDHVNKEHVKAIIDCIQICQIHADFLTRHSKHSAALSSACAEICESCAKTCEKIGGIKMQQCAEQCYKCAESCRKIH